MKIFELTGKEIKELDWVEAVILNKNKALRLDLFGGSVLSLY